MHEYNELNKNTYIILKLHYLIAKVDASSVILDHVLSTNPTLVFTTT